MTFISNTSFSQTIHDVSSILIDAQDAGTIWRILLNTVTEIFRPKDCVCYTDSDSSVLQRLDTFRSRLRSPRELPISHPIVKSALANDNIVSTASPYDEASLKREATEWMQLIGIEIAIPLIVGTHCYGIIFLSSRESGEPYSAEEAILMSTIGKLASSTLHNAYYQKKLRRLNAQLEITVHDRTLELQQTNEQLREANQAKDHFLAVVSHELLTPLTAILGWADVATVKDSMEFYRKAIDTITQSGLRQKRLIKDLLDMSRMRYEKLTLAKNPHDLWSVVSTCVNSFQQELASHEIALQLLIPPTPLFMEIDAGRVHQVIGNLLTNAIKFTPKKGQITVSGAVSESCAEIIVKDTGRGIPKESLDKIFDTFFQAHRNEQITGLGLGLALVKNIVELHGGHVHVQSAGLNQGSEFIITLSPSTPLVEIPSKASLKTE